MHALEVFFPLEKILYSTLLSIRIELESLKIMIFGCLDPSYIDNYFISDSSEIKCISYNTTDSILNCLKMRSIELELFRHFSKI